MKKYEVTARHGERRFNAESAKIAEDGNGEEHRTAKYEVTARRETGRRRTASDNRFRDKTQDTDFRL